MGQAGSFIKNTAQTGLNFIGNTGRAVVQGVKNVCAKIGQGINYIGNQEKNVWGKVRTLPVVGNIIGNSPIGKAIYTGLGLTNTLGGALQGQGSIVDATKQIISAVGGNPDKIAE